MSDPDPVTNDRIAEIAANAGEEIKIYPDMEPALLGVAWIQSKPVAVYSQKAVVDILMERDGMSEKEAEEWVDFNFDPEAPLIVDV